MPFYSYLIEHPIFNSFIDINDSLNIFNQYNLSVRLDCFVHRFVSTTRKLFYDKILIEHTMLYIRTNGL